MRHNADGFALRGVGVTVTLLLLAGCGAGPLPLRPTEPAGQAVWATPSPSAAPVDPTPSAPEPQPTMALSELPGSGAAIPTADDSPTPTQLPGAGPGAGSDGVPAATLLAELEVKGRAPRTGYARDEFGRRWADIDRNGCDQRNDVLNRDLTDVKHKDNTHGCVVLTGVLDDPFTGQRIDFVRGQDTSAKVQIDHVVALSDAWQKGAQQLSPEERERIGNDPLNLLAVDGPANQQKSDGDAATWLPPNKAFRCEYVARQIAVKHRYGLWVTGAEREAMLRVLATCPGELAPVS